MKTTLLTLTFIAFLGTVGITGCNFTTEQKAETLEDAKANLDAASLDLELARQDSAETAEYKIESEIKLKSNDLLIADMKDKMNAQRQETRAKYIKSLDSLDEQNSRLRNNMKMYSSAGKENWEKFKQGFNKELDALGKSISQLAEKNMKKGS
jgi:hypothetical protein